MKKLILTLALASCALISYAQKSDAAMQKAVDNALAATMDEKKSIKPATWTKLAKAYWDAYNNPISSLTQGIDRTTFSMMFKEQPTATEAVTVDNQTFTKVSYSHVDVYFNASDLLVMWSVTQPSVPGDLLWESAKAYQRAFELGAKDKDIAPKLLEIAKAYHEDAFVAYSLGDLARASDLFRGEAEVSTMQPCPERSDDAFYNTAYTAHASGNDARAEEYYNKCIEIKHFMDGNVYASLSEIDLAKGDTLAAKKHLVDGLTAFPSNTPILTNLINLYLSTNEDPIKIVELLESAKAAMPNNPSLYYVEGNILAGIKEYDKADAAYNHALEIQPEYDMAYYGLGLVLLKRGEDLFAEMEALDVREWKKYDAMKLQLDELYKNALVPFEKCYNVGSTDEVKAAAADYLKRLNFQLRSLAPEYQDAYEKWSAVVSQ